MRWTILRGPSFYPIRTRCRIISTCCLFHNFIKRKISVDSLKQALNNKIDSIQDIYQERITIMKISNEWNTWRGALATQIFI